MIPAPDSGESREYLPAFAGIQASAHTIFDGARVRRRELILLSAERASSRTS